MANRSELIGEFRDTVDRSIAEHVQSRQRALGGLSLSWPDMYNFATIGDLSFESVSKKHGRSSVLGHGLEHRWGIRVRRNIAGYAGHTAIIAVAGQDESLLRSWAIDAPGSQLPIRIQKQLSSDQEIEWALQWARSPHLHESNLDMLGQLDQTESAYVAEEWTRLKADADKLHKDLNAMAVARREGWRTAPQIFIQ